MTAPAVVGGLARPWTPEVAAAYPPSPARVPVDRLAFVLHAAELLNHYQPIWDHLDPGTFEIVIAGEIASDNAEIADRARERGYPARWVGDVLAGGLEYAVAVSNHPGAAGLVAGRARHALPLVARRHVRMMYGLGKDAWHFAPWNEQYDLILVWGPYQAARLAHLDRPRVVQVGYPRMDRLHRQRATRREAVARLGGDPDRPTLAWLPTWSAASSIDAFAETVAGLAADLNVLLKVHPFTALREPDRMARLAEVGLRPVQPVNLDNTELLHAADIVAADFGGSAFAAMYADRELVLLNTPGVGQDAADTIVGADSLEHRLREWILNIDPGEGRLVLEHLADPDARAQQAGVRERLRRELFAPFRGCAGEVAALVLRHLDEVLA